MLFPLREVVISLALELDRRIALFAVYTLRGEQLDLRVIDKTKLPLCRRNTGTGPAEEGVSHTPTRFLDVETYTLLLHLLEWLRQ